MDDRKTAVESALMSLESAANYLAVSTYTIRRLMTAGELAHTRVANSIRIARAELDRYIADHTSRKWQPVDGRGSARRSA